MSHKYHELCKPYLGSVVSIKVKGNKTYIGKITKVTQKGVQLSPLGKTILEAKNSTIIGKNALGNGSKEVGEEVLFFFPFFIPFLSFAARPFFFRQPFFGFGRFGVHGFPRSRFFS